MPEDNLLLLLHDDIFRYIYHEWIGSADILTLVAVDIAMCGVVARQKHLLCLTGKKVSFFPSAANSTRVCGYFISFTTWCTSRNLLLGEINLLGCPFGLSAIDWMSHTNSITSLLIDDKQKNIYDSVAHVDEWDNNGGKEEDVGKILSLLPSLKTLVCNPGIMATFSLPDTIQRSLCLCLERFSMHIPLRKVQFIQMIEFLGNHAKKLVYFKHFCHRMDDFPHIVNHLLSLQELHCEFRPDRNVVTYKLRTDYAATTIFPHFKKVHFHHIPDTLLIPFLCKCPNIDVLELQKNIFSAELEATLVTMMPQLQQLYLYGTGVQPTTTISFLQQITPSARLQKTNISDISDELLPLVVMKYPALQALSIVRGKLSSWSHLYTPSLPQHQGLMHLEKLELEEIHLPHAAMIALFAQLHLGCPLLKRLYVSLPIVSQNWIDRESLFLHALQSPLHEQLTALSLWNFSEDKVHQMGIPWHTIPVWTKLKQASFLGSPALKPLAEWFKKTPHVQCFTLSSNLFASLGTSIQLSTESKCFSLCQRTFSLVPQLRFLTCTVSALEKYAKVEFWSSIIRTCVSLNKLFVIQVENPDGCYWDCNLEARKSFIELTKAFKYRIQLAEVLQSDEDLCI